MPPHTCFVFLHDLHLRLSSWFSSSLVHYSRPTFLLFLLLSLFLLSLSPPLADSDPTEVSTVSEAVYHEYDDLRQRYKVEAESMAQAFNRATEVSPDTLHA